MSLSGYTAPSTVADCDTIDPAWGNQVVSNQELFAGLLGAESVVQASSTQVSINNSSDATTIFSYTVPANSLGTGNFYEFDIWCRAENTSASAASGTASLLYGSTTVASVQIDTTISTAVQVHLWGILGANASATAQYGQIHKGSVATYRGDDGTATENSATALTLSVTYSWSDASTDLTLTKYASKLRYTEA